MNAAPVCSAPASLTLCGMERKPFHNQYAHVDKSGGFWLEADCPACKRLRTPQVLALARAAVDEAGEPCRRCGGGREQFYRCRGCGKVYRHVHKYSDCGSATCEGEDSDPAPCPDCAGRGRVGLLLDNQRLLVLSDALEGAGVPMHEACAACKGAGRVYDYMDWQSCSACWPHRKTCGVGRVPHPLLAHLRSPEPHSVACWAINLLVGED